LDIVPLSHCFIASLLHCLIVSTWTDLIEQSLTHPLTLSEQM